MTVSIRRMSLGSGYEYLMRSVAQSDGVGQGADALTRYYAESGTPPGRFLGSGLAFLRSGRGVESGSVVGEEHLFRMLGMLQDPLTGAPLGRPPNTAPASYGDRVASRIRTETAGLTGAEREQVVDRIKAEERLRETKLPRPVAGFDLTFSAPKSVSVAWGLADPKTQAVIYDAHQEALGFVLGYAERHVFASRTGKNGVVHQDVEGVVAAAFDHWDSRAGDPQLHTHLVVMNRAPGTDGVWRTLDSRAVFKATVALSEMYNAVLSDHLTDRLGYGWQPTTRRHSAAPRYEITGVSEVLREEFSQRSTAIEDATGRLVEEFTNAHGRAPTSRQMLQLRQQATLTTRPDKHVRPFRELTDRWRHRAQPLLDEDPMTWVGSLRNRNDLPLLTAGDLAEDMLTEVAHAAVEQVAAKRSTFTRTNLLAEVLRQTHGVRFATPEDRMGVVEHTVDLAVGRSVRVSAPEVAHVPARLRRDDGTSRFRAPASGLFTTQALLDAEARLLTVGRDTTGPRLSPTAAHPQPPRDPLELSAGQTQAVADLATSGRVLDVLVGPAGTGKSTTMRALRAAWEHHYGTGSVVGLAPSAAAAQVLTDALDLPCENTHKWVVEHARQPDRMARIDTLHGKTNTAGPSLATARTRKQLHALVAETDRWRLHPDQLVIIDEASLAGTFNLDTITTAAADAGAKVVLVGDWAQLSAVEAGGVFGMLVRDRDQVPELATIHRFHHDWEATASTDLRLGRGDGIDAYTGHDRVADGDREAMLDTLYTAWKADTEAGKRSLMIAADTATVDDLNARARADRVATGTVQPDGVTMTAGSVVGVGDAVITRHNERRLATGPHAWVKNGDRWTVTRTHRDGSITVRRSSRHDGQVRLPAWYVQAHVDLGYATTAHRAQGTTVDTAHAFITPATRREVLYVAATRGRESNRLYVDTVTDPDCEIPDGPPVVRTADEVLRGVLANPGTDTSATETIATDWDTAHSIPRLLAEYDTIAALALHDRYDQLLATAIGLPTDTMAEIQQSPSYGPLLNALRDAEAHGMDTSTDLPALVQGHSLDDAHDVAAVLHRRVDHWTVTTGQARGGSSERITGLFPACPKPNDADLDQGLTDRQQLIEQRAEHTAQAAIEHGQPWAAKLGRPPDEPQARAEWFGHVVTVAAYRERWSHTGTAVLDTIDDNTSLEHQAQHHLARQAVTEARRLHRTGIASVGAARETTREPLHRDGVEL